MSVQKYKDMLQQKSVIREISVYANARGTEIGYDNVYDYSLGNPSVTPPAKLNDIIKNLLDTLEPLKLHGYSVSHGIYEVRAKIAASLSKRYQIPYEAEHVFMTAGAASSIAHAIRAVVNAGNEVITFAPFFPEYIPYIKDTGAILKIVPPLNGEFQINLQALEETITEKTDAILINSPNNPTGVIYSEEVLIALAELLRKKQMQYGHEIYIVSDEPYREIVFNNAKIPCISALYENTIMCYSFSKSISIPGERIGYIAVQPNCKEAKQLVDMCTQISRGIGHNCPSSLIQLTVAELLEETSDMQVYETNANLLYDELTKLGFECNRPQGTFYLFPKAPIEDAKQFCKDALKYDLCLVPSDSFGCPGYFRIAFCVPTKKVLKSLDAFRLLAKEYHMI